jgi:hypothetical protein
MDCQRVTLGHQSFQRRWVNTQLAVVGRKSSDSSREYAVDVDFSVFIVMNMKPQ